MTPAEENKELVRRVQFDTYTGEEDLDIIDELVSDEFVQRDPFTGETRGPDALREGIESFRTAFTDLTITINHMVAENDIVASHFTVGGTHEGSFPDLDLEPTGEEFDIEGMEFDRVEDGKLAETWLMPDTLRFLQQLDVFSDEDVPSE